MKRNSTTLFLNVHDAIVVIPWTNNSPDFSSLVEPGKSICERVWGDFVASNAGLEIISDPEPIEEPVIPNWDGLYDQLIVSGIYNYILQQSAQPQYAGIAGVMTAFAAAIIVGKQEPSNPTRLEAFRASVYGVLGTASALGIPISPEQLIEVRTILNNNGFRSIQL